MSNLSNQSQYVRQKQDSINGEFSRYLEFKGKLCRGFYQAANESGTLIRDTNEFCGVKSVATKHEDVCAVFNLGASTDQKDIVILTKSEIESLIKLNVKAKEVLQQALDTMNRTNPLDIPAPQPIAA